MTAKPKLLIIGRAGQLATCLSEAGNRQNRLAIALGRPDLDFADATSIGRALAIVKPDAVINAAAYTAVDKAETERDLAFAVNAVGPGHLAQACAGAKIPLFHVSTDMVFPDRATGEHREDDPAAPLSHYGMTKLEGEQRVASAGDAHLIARVSWLCGPAGDNFVKKVLDWAKARPELNIVANQIGRPTYAPALAAALLQLADRMMTGGPQPHTAFCTSPVPMSSRVTSWHGGSWQRAPCAAAPLPASSLFPQPSSRHRQSARSMPFSMSGAPSHVTGSRSDVLMMIFAICWIK